MAGNATRASAMPFAQPKREPCVHYLLEVISSVLEELVRSGEQEKAMGNYRQNRQVTKFNGLHPTPITIAYYLHRIAQFSGCSNECFVLMLIYIDRLVTKKNIALDAYNVHRLIISAILLSAKFFDDHFFVNPHFALVGGLKEQEMNALELEFLFLIEFNLYVTAEDYQTYYNTLAKMAHSRFMNNTLPPIPNLPHDPSNLPQPLPMPQRQFELEDDEFIAVPISCGKKEDEKRNVGTGVYPQQGYSQLDTQWVHVSPSEVNTKMNYVNNSFNDFTIVNKSPEEYDYHQGQNQNVQGTAAVSHHFPGPPPVNVNMNGVYRPDASVPVGNCFVDGYPPVNGLPYAIPQRDYPGVYGGLNGANKGRTEERAEPKYNKAVGYDNSFFSTK